MTTPRLPREDLTAAMAARRELGPDYDDAFIDTLVNRIQGSLEARSTPKPRSRAAAGPGHRDHDHSLAMAVLSLLAAIPLSAIAVVNAGLPGLLIALGAIIMINATYTFRPR